MDKFSYPQSDSIFFKVSKMQILGYPLSKCSLLPWCKNYNNTCQHSLPFLLEHCEGCHHEIQGFVGKKK